MDEKAVIFEIQRLKDEIERNRNDLLTARGFIRSAEPFRTSEGIAQWKALQPEERDKYDQAARGTDLQGSGIFFLGYRQKTT